MNKKQLTMKLSAIAVSIVLASCGGGGSEGYFNNGSSSSDNGSTTVTSAVNVSAITLTDTSGTAVTDISSLGVTATVKVTDANGKAISGAVVAFTGENMTFSTSNGTVLTNTDGEASIGITPTDATLTGVYPLTATASYDDVAGTKTANISFVKTNIVIADLGVGSSTLESGGSTLVSLVTKDSSGNYQNDQVVNFTTTCGKFSESSVTSASEGNVATTYYAYDASGNLCNGSPTITATPATSVTNAQSISVNVAAATATSVKYTTTNTVTLPVKGSGSSTSGQVEFTVYSNTTVLANQVVNISLTDNTVEGVSLDSSSVVRTKTVTSDSTGKVTINLYPGDKVGPVEVKAVLASNTSVFALSKNVTVTTGRATQNGFSLSASKWSLQNDKDGDTAIITARLVDRVGNTVPDGTVVNFVAEGGKVDGYCATSDGVCTVTLTTQNPRPANGRVTVLAYVEGDKDYIDVNGDNVYTAGTDTLTSNIGSFFRDDDENTEYTVGEYLYNRVGAIACATSTVFQPNKADTCNNGLSATLRQQMIFSFASDTPTLVGVSGVDRAMSTVIGNFNFQVFGNNALTVPMPSKTTVAVSAVDNTDSNSKSCTAELRSGNVTVPDTMDMLMPSTFPATTNSNVLYGVKVSNCATGDEIKVTITAPNKTTTRYMDYSGS